MSSSFLKLIIAVYKFRKMIICSYLLHFPLSTLARLADGFGSKEDDPTQKKRFTPKIGSPVS